MKKLTMKLIETAEAGLGVPLDYARKIAATRTSLFLRYAKIFRFLNPNINVPPLAYHCARIRGALSADCGTCVQAELNLAEQASIADDLRTAILQGRYDEFPKEIAAVARLADAVTSQRMDCPEARADVVQAYGEAGLIELSFAMNGAALLPGIKRAMGFATSCDIDAMQKIAS
jgi:hypothetical protein